MHGYGAVWISPGCGKHTGARRPGHVPRARSNRRRLRRGIRKRAWGGEYGGGAQDRVNAVARSRFSYGSSTKQRDRRSTSDGGTSAAGRAETLNQTFTRTFERPLRPEQCDYALEKMQALKGENLRARSGSAPLMASALVSVSPSGTRLTEAVHQDLFPFKTFLHTLLAIRWTHCVVEALA
ncbi:hypothetical protein B0G81_0470 [Paraburkholderia sp. BL6665CI2N2]|nr:hypothetical protein B0G81_0470 [Paraburkholderia sp. BL6665CI2N2]